MLTELILLSPFLFFWWWGYIHWIFLLLPAFLYYWLPKLLISSILDYFFPTLVYYGRKKSLTAKKRIALTFDDVPFAASKKILDLLNKYDAKATFFVISDPDSVLEPLIRIHNMTRETPYKIDKSETDQILIQAIQQGHQLGNHGKSNSMHLIRHLWSGDLIQKEIQPCDQYITSLYRKADRKLPKIMVYRPGCGLFNSSMLKLVESKGYTTVLGSIYPHDPVVPIATLNYWYVIAHLGWEWKWIRNLTDMCPPVNKELEKLEFREDIVILHDRLWSVTLIEKLLKYLKKNSYELVTLDELLTP